MKTFLASCFAKRKVSRTLAGRMVLIMTTSGCGGFLLLHHGTGSPRRGSPADSYRVSISKDGAIAFHDNYTPPPTLLTIVLRIVELVAIFLPVGVAFLLAFSDDGRRRARQQALRALERAGPTFVKFGQWATARRDLFSPELREFLSELYDNAAHHSFDETLAALQEDLNVPASEFFSNIEETPLGSGSIGQVHRAVLRSSGETVAVKVAHPRIVETISVDAAIIMRVTAAIDAIIPGASHYKFPHLARTFLAHLAAQLDLRHEHEQLDRFNDNFSAADHVRFPRPITSSCRVLVETFEAGWAMDAGRLQQFGDNERHAMATGALDTFCQMLLVDGFIHGDMHPGNILIDDTSLATSSRHAGAPQMVMLDAGLCQTFCKREANVYRDLMRSLVEWDPVLNADAILRMTDGQNSLESRSAFIADTKAAFAGEISHTSATSDNGKQTADISGTLDSIFGVIRKHRLVLEPGYVQLLASVMILESFMQSVAPDHDFIGACRPWVVRDALDATSANLKAALGVLAVPLVAATALGWRPSVLAAV